MMPFPAFLLPALLGGGIGAATSKDPLKGALIGGVGGALTGGLGGLGGLGGAGSAAGATGAAGLNVPAGMSIAGAMPSAAANTSLGAASAIPHAVGQSAVQGAALGPLAEQSLMSPENLKTMGGLAGAASQAGMFQDPPQAPVASAGIPGGSADFTGLLSKRPQMSGAQLLMMQRKARRG